jgi:hypothetical protein
MGEKLGVKDFGSAGADERPEMAKAIKEGGRRRNGQDQDEGFRGASYDD